MTNQVYPDHHTWPEMKDRLFYLLGIALGSKKPAGGSSSEKCALALATERPEFLPPGYNMEEAGKRINQGQKEWVDVIRESLSLTKL